MIIFIYCFNNTIIQFYIFKCSTGLVTVLYKMLFCKPEGHFSKLASQLYFEKECKFVIYIFICFLSLKWCQLKSSPCARWEHKYYYIHIRTIMYHTFGWKSKSGLIMTGGPWMQVVPECRWSLEQVWLYSCIFVKFNLICLFYSFI